MLFGLSACRGEPPLLQTDEEGADRAAEPRQRVHLHGATASKGPLGLHPHHRLQSISFLASKAEPQGDRPRHTMRNAMRNARKRASETRFLSGLRSFKWAPDVRSSLISYSARCSSVSPLQIISFTATSWRLERVGHDSSIESIHLIALYIFNIIDILRHIFLL